MWRISDFIETRPPQHVFPNIVAVAEKGVSRGVPNFFGLSPASLVSECVWLLETRQFPTCVTMPNWVALAVKVGA